MSVQNPVARTGLYEHPIIQELVDFLWSADESDEDIKYAVCSETGIPLVVIARVLTIVCPANFP